MPAYRNFIGPLFRREYERDKIAGVVSQVEEELYVWWCWRRTGKTISGVHGRWLGAEQLVTEAMKRL